MEYGQLKADYRDQVASSSTASVEEERALQDASEKLRCEATDLLRLAGAAPISCSAQIKFRPADRGMPQALMSQSGQHGVNLTLCHKL